MDPVLTADGLISPGLGDTVRDFFFFLNLCTVVSKFYRVTACSVPLEQKDLYCIVDDISLVV